MNEVTIKVGGMSCGGCVGSVTRVLQALEGVERVDVSLETGEAHIGYDAARIGVPVLCQTIEDAGFSASAL